jgi:hypothetical protein
MHRSFILIVACLLVSGCGSPIKVIVRNASDHNLEAVTVHIPYHSFTIGEIQKNGTGEASLREINVESSVVISFLGEHGEKITYDCDIYIDRGFVGEINVTIERGYFVLCKGNVNTE